MKLASIRQTSPVMELPDPCITGISLVCFRINPADTASDEKVLEKINRQVLAHIFWGNPAFISSTLLHGTFSLRLCIVPTTPRLGTMCAETLEASEGFGREALSERKAW